MSLLLALLLAGTDGGVDAGVDFTDSLYATCPDAPLSVPMDGGVWLPDPRPARIACLMATCEADRHRRVDEKTWAPPPTWWVLAVSAAVGFGALGFTLGRYTAPTTSPAAPPATP